MRTALKIAFGFALGAAAASAVVHRRVIMATIKGDPLPEPPEWHKKWHPCFKK